MKKRIFQRMVGPLILLLVVYFFVDVRELAKIITLGKWSFFGLSLVLVPIFVFVKSIRWGSILKNFGISYSRWQCFRIYFVEMVAIMVVATVGTFVKIFYPRRDGHGLLRPFLSVIVDKYYDYLLPFVFGTTSAVLLWAELPPDVSVIVLFVVTCVAFIPARKIVGVLSPRIIPSRLKDFFFDKGWNVSEHMVEIQKALNSKIYMLSVAGFCVYYLTVYFLAKSMNIGLSLSEIVLVMTITSLVSFVPISFFGLGTRDVGLLVVFKWFGHKPEEAVALSMALLLLRVAIVMMGSIFWFADPPTFTKLDQD